MEKGFVLAIDGPAGAGKSTIAKLAAGKLGFAYIVVLDKIHTCRHVTLFPHGAPTSGRGADSAGKDYTVAEVASRDDYYYEFREFIDCVLSGKESAINSPDTSIAVLRILDQVRLNQSL